MPDRDDEMPLGYSPGPRRAEGREPTAARRGRLLAVVAVAVAVFLAVTGLAVSQLIVFHPKPPAVTPLPPIPAPPEPKLPVDVP